ncbi:MAG: CYTH domain-containing protein [Pseudomonadota bacterium]
MGQEIEHKFLVDKARWRPHGAGVLIRQGYLSVEKDRVVRIRTAGPDAYITIKGPGHVSRAEFEYAIPLDDANLMLDTLCLPGAIDKTRYEQNFGGHLWQIDVFHGDNEGLLVAEIELKREGERFERPDWLLEEVSHDPRYFNASLSKAPFKTWA